MYKLMAGNEALQNVTLQMLHCKCYTAMLHYKCYRKFNWSFWKKEAENKI